jgi:branched-chain amino acid transport system permease protein
VSAGSATTAAGRWPLNTIRTRRGQVTALAWVLGVAALAALPFTLSDYYLFLVDVTLLTAMAATGLNLVMGYAGLASIGNAAFLGIGAYTEVIVTMRFPTMPVPALVVLGGLTSGIVGILIGIPSLRLRGLYLAVTTLALQFIASYGFRRMQEVQEAIGGYRVPLPDLDMRGWYAVLLTLLVLLLLGLHNLVNSKLGRGWMAIRENEPAAEGCGVDVRKYKLVAFFISGLVIGCVGVLSATFNGTVNWETYSLNLAVQYLAMIIIGGMGYLLGGVVGAAVVILLPAIIANLGLGSSSTSSLIQDSIYGVLVIVFLVVKPSGLSGIASDWFRRFTAPARVRADD